VSAPPGAGGSALNPTPVSDQQQKKPAGKEEDPAVTRGRVRKLQATTRSEARRTFLEVVERREPRVLKSLQSVWRRLPPEGIGGVAVLVLARELSEIARLPKSDLQSLYKLYGKVSKVDFMLCLWARRWNLCEMWLMHEAMMTLDRWTKQGRPSGWAYKGYIEAVKGVGFHLTFPAWDPQADKWVSYRRKLQAAFGKAVSEYRAVVSGYHESSEAPGEMSPRASLHKGERHFEWLVNFQIRRMEIKEVDESDEPADYKTIDSAIRDLAALIGLRLREKMGKPGPAPRK
jgi:hypothetical protein